MCFVLLLEKKMNKGSVVFVGNKCGVRFVKIFHIYGGGVCKLSTFLYGSVRFVDSTLFYNIKNKVKLLVVQTKTNTYRFDGSVFFFLTWLSVVLKKKNLLAGGSTNVVALHELKRKRFFSFFLGII